MRIGKTVREYEERELPEVKPIEAPAVPQAVPEKVSTPA